MDREKLLEEQLARPAERGMKDEPVARLSVGGAADEETRAVNEEQGFLHAISENRHDETTRLVYADWLEENGHADRAAYLRAEGEIAVTFAQIDSLLARFSRRDETTGDGWWESLVSVEVWLMGLRPGADAAEVARLLRRFARVELDEADVEADVLPRLVSRAMPLGNAEVLNSFVRDLAHLRFRLCAERLTDSADSVANDPPVRDLDPKAEILQRDYAASLVARGDILAGNVVALRRRSHHLAPFATALDPAWVAAVTRTLCVTFERKTAPEKRISCILIIRQIKSIGLAEGAALVESAPFVVHEAASFAEALRTAELFRGVGVVSFRLT